MFRHGCGYEFFPCKDLHITYFGFKGATGIICGNEEVPSEFTVRYSQTPVLPSPAS